MQNQDGSLATKIKNFEFQEAQMEQILEQDRKFGEDDYGDKKEEIASHQYMTAKFGTKVDGPLVPGGMAEEYDEKTQP